VYFDNAKAIQKQRSPDTQEEYPRHVEKYEKSHPEPRFMPCGEDPKDNHREHKECEILQPKICTRHQNGISQPQKISYGERSYKERRSNSQPRPLLKKEMSEKKGRG